MNTKRIPHDFDAPGFALSDKDIQDSADAAIPQAPQKVTEQATTRYIVVVTDSDTGKRRDVEFDNETGARCFRAMAEEDGTYWGYYTVTRHESEQGSTMHAPFAPSVSFSPKSDLPAAVKEVIRIARLMLVYQNRPYLLQDLELALAALGEHEKE